MTLDNIKSAIESILFASADGVDVKKLSEIFNEPKKNIENIVKDIVEKFEKSDSGIRVLKLDAKIQMCSKTENSEFVKQILETKRRTPLSTAAMEVLAIISYNQPVTKAFIEQVRGIDSSSIVNNLVQKELIEEKGRLNLPGRPIMYGTTINFLRCFGIESLDHLPPIPKKNNLCEDVL